MNKFTYDNIDSMIEETIGKDWMWEEVTIAFSHSFEKSIDKRLGLSVGFDGYGNSIVRFVVSNRGESTRYEKYDSAVEAYNMLRG